MRRERRDDPRLLLRRRELRVTVTVKLVTMTVKLVTVTVTVTLVMVTVTLGQGRARKAGG